MAPSKGWGGGPAAGEGSTIVTRSFRSDRIGPTLCYSGDRPAAAPTVGKGGTQRLDKYDKPVDAGGIEEEEEEAVARRGYYTGRYPNTAPRRPTPAAPTAGGTSADGAEEAVPTCGRYRDTAPRRPVGADSTGLGEGGVARCGFRNPTRRCPTPPGRDPTPCARMGAAASCIPVATGGRGGRGGRGHRDTYDHDGTSRPRAPELHAPTADLPAKNDETLLPEAIDECFEFGPVDNDKVSLGVVNRSSTCRRMLINRVPSAVTGFNGSLSCGRVASARSFSSSADLPPHQDIGMPSLSPTMTEGNIAKWLKKEGDKLSPGEVLCEVETDKAVEMECMEEGYLAKIVQGDGAKEIKVGEVICVTVEEEGDIEKFKDYKPSAADAPAAPSELKATPEPADPKVEEKVPAKAPVPKAPKDNNDAEKKRLGTIGEEVKQLAQRARDNSLKPQDYETFSEVPDFVCSDRGGSFGSKKGKWNYISKMNYYLRAGSVSDIKPISDREARSSYSLRYEELKERCCDLAEVPALLSTCASIKSSGADIVTQIFIDVCGSTISLQKNLSKLDINMLTDAAFVRAGVKPSDFYSTFAGQILDPNRLLSCYQIPKDSTIRVNARLRGGCAGDKTWDDIIRAQQYYVTVSLPPEDLVFLRPDGSAEQGPVLVKYLAARMQFRSRKVLIQLCRKHYSGTSYGGKITSKNILFDSDGNVRIDSAPEKFSQGSAKLDYVALGTILDNSFKDHVNNCYPMHFYQLVDFLRYGPAVDCQSEAVIAFVTNHVSLLSHYERVKISEILVQLIERLDSAVVTVLLASLDKFFWGQTVENVSAMKHTYYFHSRTDKAGKILVPYVENGVSLLKFSNNFFKHHNWASLEQLDAAFSLVMARRNLNFIPRCLLTILVTLKNSKNQCPALIESFIDQVVGMLGNNVIDLERG